MKYSMKLSNAVHILVLIALNPYGDLSSTTIAKSIHTNSGFVRQLMMLLRKANLIRSVAGRACPTLARDPEEISLLDIHKAVEGSKPLLQIDLHTNPECEIGTKIQSVLQKNYDKVQNAAENEIKKISLKNIIDACNINN